METYSFLRELADSWVMLALLLFFLGTWVFAFRPGSRPIHDDAAGAVFRHDEPAPPRRAARPAPAAPAPEAKQPCGRGCEGCTCAPLDFLQEYRNV